MGLKGRAHLELLLQDLCVVWTGASAEEVMATKQEVGLTGHCEQLSRLPLAEGDERTGHSPVPARSRASGSMKIV